jgi:hypothetical protein
MLSQQGRQRGSNLGDACTFFHILPSRVRWQLERLFTVSLALSSETCEKD